MPFVSINSHALHHTDILPSSPSTNTTGKSETLIFIHALGSTQNYFFPILPYLTAYRCILFDNHGAGRSPLATNSSTSIPSIAADVLGLLDNLNVNDEVIAVGYSMGGMVPTYLASTSPERVKAAVLIGPVHPTPQVANVFAQRIPLVQKEGMDAMANTIPNAATGPDATALQKAFIRELLLAQTVGGYVANCRAIEQAQPAVYSDVKCPVLIVAGEVDKSAPIAGCELIMGQLGTENEKKRMEVLKGCGHWHCIERADEVGKLLREFADGL